MGYHTADEIPNYWAYAQNFVLQDPLFEGVRSWSAPSHLDLTSEWVARCTDHNDAQTCTTSTQIGQIVDIPGSTCSSSSMRTGVLEILSRLRPRAGLPGRRVDLRAADPDAAHGLVVEPDPLVQIRKGAGANLSRAAQSDHRAVPDRPEEQYAAAGFLDRARRGIQRAPGRSRHHRHGIRHLAGQCGDAVARLELHRHLHQPGTIGAVSTITWCRRMSIQQHTVPGPGFWSARAGPDDQPLCEARLYRPQVLSFDSYATFFEDLFAGGARLDPAALGNPDSRPDQRDSLQRSLFWTARRRRLAI